MDIQLTLESDATFGQGSGQVGPVDNEVQHDPETGLPFLRGRTLKGLLVEECSTLLYAIEHQDRGRSDPLEDAAQFLYGSPGSKSNREARMRIGRARLPEELRRAVKADVDADRLNPSDVLDSLTAIRRQTAIDDETGAPDPGTLRASRVILRQTPFRASLRFRKPPSPNALSLLAACVRSLRRAGTRRNRGRGVLSACLLENGDDVTEQHYARFKSLVRPSSSPEVQSSESTSFPEVPHSESQDKSLGSSSNSGAEPVVLTYQIQLREPTLVTSIEGDSNSAVAFNYLPGSALRGALIGEYMARRGLSSDYDLAGDTMARHLFFDGDVRFLNGYPLDPVRQADPYDSGVRMWPTPLSYYHEKGEKESVYDFSVGGPSSDDQTQWQNIGGPFASVNNGTAHFHQPDRHIAVHNRRDRKKGRPTKQSGEFFRYDALAPRQTFEASILCPDELSASELKPLLGGTLTLGGSRSVDYGLASIEKLEEQRGDAWHEVGDAPPQPQNGETVAVLLLSNTLVRDKRGHHTASVEAVAKSVRDCMGLDKNKMHVGRSFVRTEVVGGFNRKWGLPLPQTPSLGMGSVIEFQIPEFSTGDPQTIERKLSRLEREGIGERRAEGFGRVAVNRHVFDRALRVKRKVEYGSSHASYSVGDDVSRRIAEAMTERMLRKQLDAALIERVNALARGISSPSKSQLARLRAAFRDAVESPPNEGRSYLMSFLEGLPQTSRRQLTSDRIGNSRVLLEWLKYRIEDEERIWKDLKVSDKDLPEIGDVQATRSAKLAYEYNLRFAHDTLARAAKLKD